MSASEPALPGVSARSESTQPVGPSVRVRVGVGAAIVLVVAALVASVLITALTPVGATTVVSDARTSAPSPALPAAASGGASAPPAGGAAASGVPPSGGPVAGGSVLLVHVLGAVASAGVYELPGGSRVVDAVAAAGGLLPTAEAGSINLARPLVDGEQLRVLAVGEAPPEAAPPGAAAGGQGSAGSGSAGPGPSGGALINLNAASEIDLDALPRIGPAMASRIVEYRSTNGPFTSVDDLLQVPGIGEKTLENLRPLVTV
ncbi:helix-hairpin-helix domain-containing protein [Herbiconiux sp. P18]|uniref:helix-hairpin-helix domain-containing protein n=1 Tax=Herbiconiux liangxiaofengii TaxID=3342795 RepID=UPI0035B79BCB